MKSRKLFGTDLEISPICLGTAGFGTRVDKDTAFSMLDLFLDAVGRLVDTANIYARDKAKQISKSEEILGLYLKEHPNTELTVATKGAHYDLTTKENRVNRKCIEADLDESLCTLGLDRIDLYWLHRDDENRPVEEIIDIMEDFVRKGKIAYYGASNYTVKRLAEAKTYADRIGVKGFSAVSNYWTPLKENAGHPLSADTTLVTCKNGDLSALAELKLPLLPYSSTAKGWVAKGVGQASEKLNLCFDNAENRAFREEIVKKSLAENCSVQTALLRYMSALGDTAGLQLIPITACSNLAQLDEIIKF